MRANSLLERYVDPMGISNAPSWYLLDWLSLLDEVERVKRAGWPCTVLLTVRSRAIRATPGRGFRRDSSRVVSGSWQRVDRVSVVMVLVVLTSGRIAPRALRNVA